MHPSFLSVEKLVPFRAGPDTQFEMEAEGKHGREKKNALHWIAAGMLSHRRGRCFSVQWVGRKGVGSFVHASG